MYYENTAKERVLYTLYSSLLLGNSSDLTTYTSGLAMPNKLLLSTSLEWDLVPMLIR